MLEGIDLKNLSQVKHLPVEDQREVLELLEDLEEAKKKEVARDSFLGFVNYVWPIFIEGRHHKVIANAFERVIKGDLKRLIINMPPRHTKSEFASYLLPAWFLGQNPEKKVIQTSHTAELSVGFGRKVRNLVDSEDFKEIFPALALRADSKAAGVPIRAGNTSLSVLAVRLQVKVLIYSSLTIHIPSRTGKALMRLYLIKPMNGIPLAHDNDYNQAVQSLSL